MEYTVLNNGVKMPLIGFGTMGIENNQLGEKVILDALNTGYRMIDTAAAYSNEEIIGSAIKKSGIARDELFIVSKLWVQDAGYENTKQAFNTSLKKLGLNYLDAYLIHVPFGDYYGSWRAMEELYAKEKIRVIGVCNFYPARLADFCLNTVVTPAVCQVELHPFYQQEEALANMKHFHVQPEGWSPLAHARNDIFANEVLSKIAEKYNKTVGQIVLRWNIQRGCVVIPKTVQKKRMLENIAIWDFSLTAEEMQCIAQLDTGYTEEDARSLTMAIQANQWKIHS